MTIPHTLNHSFNTRYAEEYGIEGAILIFHFHHWIAYNAK